MTDRAIPAAPSRVAHFQDQLPDSKIISGQAVHSGSRVLLVEFDPRLALNAASLHGGEEVLVGEESPLLG
jgi:hypothetical protein